MSIIELTTKLEKLLRKGLEHLSESSEAELSKRPSPEKWSKKEILGHLIDSGINNLQRFTEIQFENKPYTIRNYNQEALVKANDYQNAASNEIINFWLSLNNRILNIIRQQTEETLKFEIVLDDDSTSDFEFLVKDYIDHLEHHLNQIKAK